MKTTLGSRGRDSPAIFMQYILENYERRKKHYEECVYDI